MKSIIILSFLIAGIFFINSVSADPLVQVTSSVSPSPVAPGTDGYVQLTFTNAGTGTSATASIQITDIYTDSNVKFANNGIVNVGSLGTGQSTSAVFKFSVAASSPSGLYTIKFVANICGTSCSVINPTVVVTVQSPSTLQVISIQPDTLSAGQTTTLNFNLFNEGTDTISNIIFSWQTPDNEILPLGTSNRQYITSLTGETALTIPVNVSVSSSASPAVYPLTIQLAYYDKSGQKQNVTSTIGIKIGGTTDFDVGLQQYSAGTLSLSVANIGVNPATSVSVSIPQQNSFVVSGASSSFLGTLNSGDFSIASFQVTRRVTRSQNANGNGNLNESGIIGASTLTLQISYSDTSGSRQILQKEISLDLSSSQVTGTTGITTRSRSINYFTIILIVVAIIAVFLLWYFKLRKNKTFLSLMGKISTKFKK
jgi:hypothetical protein